MHIRMKDPRVVLHGWWDQGILIRYPYVQLEDSALIWSAVWALRTMIICVSGMCYVTRGTRH